MLAGYLDGTGVPYASLRRRLAQQTRRGKAFPVLFGSALTGAGTDSLAEAVTELFLPAPGTPTDPVGQRLQDRARSGRAEAGVRASVLRDPADSRPAAVRLRPRGQGHRHPGIRRRHRPAARPGDRRAIASCPAWSRCRSATPSGDRATSHPAFAPPTLETVVTPTTRLTRGRYTGPYPARRAGPADQPAAGSGDRPGLRLALRGAEGGGPGHPGRRLRCPGRFTEKQASSASNGRSASGSGPVHRHAGRTRAGHGRPADRASAVGSVTKYAVAGDRRGMSPAFLPHRRSRCPWRCSRTARLAGADCSSL